MTNKLPKFGILIFAFIVMFVSTLKAQETSCGLRFKIFSYNAVASETPLTNVEVTLTNIKTKEKRLLKILPESSGFDNLPEAKYRVQVAKNGYQKRKKDIKLECGFADNESLFNHHIYLWKDKSDSGEQMYTREDIVNSKDSVSADEKTKPESVPQSENFNSKSDKSKLVGKVTVKVIIDEDGNVVSATALDGSKELIEKAVKAARLSKFAPTMLAGNPVQVTGSIIYNFVP